MSENEPIRLEFIEKVILFFSTLAKAPEMFTQFFGKASKDMPLADPKKIDFD